MKNDNVFFQDFIVKRLKEKLQRPALTKRQRQESKLIKLFALLAYFTKTYQFITQFFFQHFPPGLIDFTHNNYL
jgi:hypothetical protein